MEDGAVIERNAVLLVVRDRTGPILGAVGESDEVLDSDRRHLRKQRAVQVSHGGVDDGGGIGRQRLGTEVATIRTSVYSGGRAGCSLEVYCDRFIDTTEHALVAGGRPWCAHPAWTSNCAPDGRGRPSPPALTYQLCISWLTFSASRKTRSRLPPRILRISSAL